MLLEAQRVAVVDTCRRMVADGLVVGTAGNVSARDGELVAVTPTAVPYQALAPAQVAVFRLDGTPVEAPLAPTSELPLHLAAYRATGAGAVVHTHPVAATALSCLVRVVPPVHYYAAMFGGTGVPVAPYAPYGSRELADGVATALRDRTPCRLATHGAVTVGADLGTAYQLTAYLEWLCEVALRVVSAGAPAALLTGAQLAEVAPRLAAYRPDSGPEGGQP
jgi:L-fuculose-phosphate aldolase